MGRSVYSIVLDDDVVEAVDIAAHQAVWAHSSGAAFYVAFNFAINIDKAIADDITQHMHICRDNGWHHTFTACAGG